MLNTDHNEADLVEGAKAGDADAFGELYLIHLDPIFRYVYYRIGDLEEAKDLADQVFLKAWEALPGYKDRGNPFSSWLYRIAHNIVVDHHRRKKPADVVEFQHQDEDFRELKSTLTQVIEIEESNSLAFAISNLPEDQQQVIILRFIEGLNHTDISQIMGKSEGACRMLQHRALVTLSQIIKPAEG